MNEHENSFKPYLKFCEKSYNCSTFGFVLGIILQQHMKCPMVCFIPALPDDVVPIFLSSKTQEIMACVPYEDVTEESPFKILKKEDIQKDMFNRAAISDFSPMKDMFNVSSDHTISGTFFYRQVTSSSIERILDEFDRLQQSITARNKDSLALLMLCFTKPRFISFSVHCDRHSTPNSMSCHIISNMCPIYRVLINVGYIHVQMVLCKTSLWLPLHRTAIFKPFPLTRLAFRPYRCRPTLVRRF